jgi:transposase-like protein
MTSIDDLFKGRHFDREIIILCVRWYPRFKLSLRGPHDNHALDRAMRPDESGSR